jgi:hypothetical protein
MNSQPGQNLNETWYGVDEYTLFKLTRGEHKPHASRRSDDGIIVNHEAVQNAML